MNVMKDEWGGIVHGEMNRYRRMNLFAHEQEHATLAWSNKWYDDPRPRIIDSDLTIDWLLKFDLKFEMVLWSVQFLIYTMHVAIYVYSC